MSPVELIDKQIEQFKDWRGGLLKGLRRIILEADPDIQEDWKWNTAVWVRNGNVCAAGIFKDHVKINFFKGALIDDKNKLFNAGLEAKNSRAIDFYENDPVNELALKDLVRAAVELNLRT